MKTAEALERFGRRVNIQHFFTRVRLDSGFLLFAATQLLHLRDNHPGQDGHNDGACNDHLHVRNREAPGRGDSDCLHGVPPNLWTWIVFHGSRRPCATA
jgi:hypothetical protein